ncbi:MAG: NAD(P)H-hydrate dehydratase [Candidatus Omnitrophota bacterium]
MLVLVGTVPNKSGLHIGKASAGPDGLKIGGAVFPVERGTAAMAASAAMICGFYGFEAPLCIFGADTGDGVGTNMMFHEVFENLDKYDPDIVTLHYMFPKVGYGGPLMAKVYSLKKKPQLIADAGGMYLMKATKLADKFDVFTPDQGELYFLADEMAPHPLYVREEVVNRKPSVDSLAVSAYKGHNTAKVTVIKGATDYVYDNGVKTGEVSMPNIPAMEAIGGTGDTITGMLSALRFKKDPSADTKALILNRIIGKAIRCSPATQISEFIKAIPAALEEYEKEYR